MQPKNLQGVLRPLRLTADEEQMISEEANRVIQETVAVNEFFIACGRSMPKSDWKHLKTKENVQVYRARKEAQGDLERKFSEAGARKRSSTGASAGSFSGYTESSRGSESMSSRSDSSGSSSGKYSDTNPCGQQSVVAKMKPADIPLVVATGIVAGTVEEAAFGALAYTERLWRHRDAHLQDEFDESAILAEILLPTLHDPFRSLVVKWSAKTVGALSRMRDCVYIEANGIAMDSNGEQFAYSLKHSIDWIPRIPGLKHLDVVRVNMSTCYIARQYNQSSIEVFCRGFADAGCSFSDVRCRSVYPEMVLSYVHIVDCAYVKKLVWLMHRKQQQGDSITLLSSSSQPTNCTLCSSAFCKLTNLVHPWVPCQACRKVVCHRCSVVKKLPLEVSSTEIKHKAVTFCLHCMVEAKETSARKVAIVTM